MPGPGMYACCSIQGSQLRQCIESPVRQLNGNEISLPLEFRQSTGEAYFAADGSDFSCIVDDVATVSATEWTLDWGDNDDFILTWPFEGDPCASYTTVRGDGSSASGYPAGAASSGWTMTYPSSDSPGIMNAWRMQVRFDGSTPKQYYTGHFIDRRWTLWLTNGSLAATQRFITFVSAGKIISSPTVLECEFTPDVPTFRGVDFLWPGVWTQACKDFYLGDLLYAQFETETNMYFLVVGNDGAGYHPAWDEWGALYEGIYFFPTCAAPTPPGTLFSPGGIALTGPGEEPLQIPSL